MACANSDTAPFQVHRRDLPPPPPPCPPANKTSTRPASIAGAPTPSQHTTQSPARSSAPPPGAALSTTQNEIPDAAPSGRASPAEIVRCASSAGTRTCCSAPSPPAVAVDEIQPSSAVTRDSRTGHLSEAECVSLLSASPLLFPSPDPLISWSPRPSPLAPRSSLLKPLSLLASAARARGCRAYYQHRLVRLPPAAEPRPAGQQDRQLGRGEDRPDRRRSRKGGERR